MIKLNVEVLEISVRVLGVAAIATLLCACGQAGHASQKSNTTIISQGQGSNMEEVVIVASRK